jgi:hypothetical protein
MPSDFLIRFHSEHFSNTDVPIYSLELFYKLLEIINEEEQEDKQ